MSVEKTTLGIVGGGQLGMMMVEPAHALGLEVVVLDPTPNSPAGKIAARQIIAPYADRLGTVQLAEASDVITVEIEHVNTSALEKVDSEGIPVFPSPETIRTIQDKYIQKAVLQAGGLPVTPFRKVNKIDDVLEAAEEWDYPIHLKTRLNAFDGRGNSKIEKANEIEAVWNHLSKKGPLYVEKHIPFKKELSVVLARDQSGSIITYPVVETQHVRNICHTVLAPAPVKGEIAKQAEILAIQTLGVFKGAGVFAVEMFLDEEEKLYINEVAPRVHNSGHWTQLGSQTSQFENHVRAVVGYPVGNTDMTAPAAVMINILGNRNGKAEPLGIEDAKNVFPGNISVVIYGKEETRPDRKMGHINVVADTLDEALEAAQRARAIITI